MMNIKEFTKAIDGFEYPARELSKFDNIARENGFTFIYGMSDDLLEFGGVINDERGAWDGLECVIGTANLGVKAVWSPKDKPNTSWEIIVGCPHEKFTIMEDGEVFCIGVVVHKDYINS